MNVRIFKVLDISTAHLPEEVVRKMEEFDGYPTMYNHPLHYGTIVIVPYVFTDEDVDKSEEENLRLCWGNEFTDILKYAFEKHGCWAVNFDCDGKTYDEFPIFEW